jgi:hypothetical protein
MATRFLPSGTKVTTRDGRGGVVLEYKSQQSVIVNIPPENTMWPFPTIIDVPRKELKVIEEEYEDALF